MGQEPNILPHYSKRKRRRGTLLALLWAFIVLSTPGFPQDKSPGQLLDEADRLFWLDNWLKARPLFAEAEKLFLLRGDSRNALYAEFSRLRADVEGMSYPEVSRYLEGELGNPIVQNDPKLRLRCLVVKGAIDLNIDPISSRLVWKEVQALAKSLGDKGWQARASGELGILAFLDGNSAEAQKMVSGALLTAMSLRDVGGQIRYLTMLGDGYTEYGRAQEALAFFDKALQLAEANQEAGFPLRSYIGKAGALRGLKQFDEARALLERALNYATLTNTQGAQADLLFHLGRLARERGDRQDARRHLEDAAALASRTNFRRIFSAAQFQLAQLFKEAGELALAEQAMRQGLATSRRSGESYALPHQLAVAAELELAAGKVSEADALFSEARDVADGMLVNAPSPVAVSALVGAMSEIYVGHFTLAVNGLRDLNMAFRILEQARGRATADVLHSRPEDSGERSAKRSAAETEIADLQIRLLQAKGKRERKRLLERLTAAEFRLAPIEQERYHSRIQAGRAPVELRAAQRRVQPGELILEYVLSEPASFCFVISRDNVNVKSLPARRQIEGVVDKYLAGLRAKTIGREEAGRLYSWLLEGVPEHLKAHRLVIVPDGKLHALPFESLMNADGRYLVESHIVSYAPSATVLHLLRQFNRKDPASLPFLGVWHTAETLEAAALGNRDSVSRGVFDLQGINLAPLLYAKEEVSAAGQIAGRDRAVLLGPVASEAAVKSEPLNDFSILHFAVHGIGNNRFPERSALLLGSDPSAHEDGLLQAREIRRLKLKAELVVLSACDTGVGKIEGQEGIADLVRAFLFAGAKSVVASLWPLDDRFTTTLVKRFYGHLARGEDKSQALQRAKLDILREFGQQAVPYYWAGLKLVGEGSKPIPIPLAEADKQ